MFSTLVYLRRGMSRSTYSLASFSYAWESTDTKLYHAVTDEDKKRRASQLLLFLIFVLFCFFSWLLEDLFNFAPQSTFGFCFLFATSLATFLATSAPFTVGW